MVFILTFGVLPQKLNIEKQKQAHPKNRLLNRPNHFQNAPGQKTDDIHLKWRKSSIKQQLQHTKKSVWQATFLWE